MYSTDTSLFFSHPASRPRFVLRLFLFLRTGICRMSMFYSVVFIRTVRILYFAGCLVRNKATLVMHLGMIFSH